MIDLDDIKPYSDEWCRAVKRMKKEAIINLFQRMGQEKVLVEAKLKEKEQLYNNLLRSLKL